MPKMDEKEFEKIYKNTYNNLLRFIVINCYNFDNLNDIIQDTYIEFYKILKKKKTIHSENINAFICGIAKNIIKRHYNKNRKLNIYQNIDDENNTQVPDNFDLEQKIINKENIKQVWEYIKNKDYNTFKIFYLYFVLDEKIADIAKELKINESTVKNKIYRTLKELKNVLGEEEKDYE